VYPKGHQSRGVNAKFHQYRTLAEKLTISTLWERDDGSVHAVLERSALEQLCEG